MNSFYPFVAACVSIHVVRFIAMREYSHFDNKNIVSAFVYISCCYVHCSHVNYHAVLLCSRAVNATQMGAPTDPASGPFANGKLDLPRVPPSQGSPSPRAPICLSFGSVRGTSEPPRRTSPLRCQRRRQARTPTGTEQRRPGKSGVLETRAHTRGRPGRERGDPRPSLDLASS
jgi:hypothetical protein